jgi:hypothetical protein
MRVFLIILTLVTLQNMAKAADESFDIQDQLTTMTNEEKCLDYVETLDITDEQTDAANDQCMDQAY